MKSNLTQKFNLSVETGPYKVVSQAQLIALVDGDVSTSALVVSGESLSLVFDLGARHRLSSLIYFRTSASVDNVVIYGKQGTEGHVWEELTTQVTSDSVSVTFAENLGHFQQLKILHTVSAGTSAVQELQVWSEDKSTGFGQQGSTSTFSVAAGIDNLQVEEIQVFNYEEVAADVFCAIDLTTNNYTGLSISPTLSGTFYSAHESGISIPVDFPWSAGSLHNLVEVDNKLTLVTGTYGYYYSPVLDVDTVTGRRVFWESTLSGTSNIDDTSSLNSIPTFSIRQSNVPPSDVAWLTGELSVDSMWSTVSGTLPFVTYSNDTALPASSEQYFQVKVELVSETEGHTPILEKIGIENAISVSVPPQGYSSVYVKSSFTEHTQGRTSGLVTWSPEKRNIDQ